MSTPPACTFAILAVDNEPTHNYYGCTQHGQLSWSTDPNYCLTAAQQFFPGEWKREVEERRAHRMRMEHEQHVERLRRDLVRLNNRLRTLDTDVASPEQRRILHGMKQAGMALTIAWSEL